MSIKRVYYWVGLTVTQPFNTGVQRVTRCLAVELQKRGIEVIPVKSVERQMVPITQDEADHLAKWGGPSLKPPSQSDIDSAQGHWLIVPEITPGVDGVGIGKAMGMKVAAIFYDLIPLKTPEYYTPGTIDWLNEYWGRLAPADVILPISETVRFDLIEWFLKEELRVGFISSVLLAGEIPGVPRSTVPAAYGNPFNLVAIGTWEPRKNYPRILHALKTARELSGINIRLTIVGRKASTEYGELQNDMERLASEMSDTVVLKDYVSDEELEALFDNAQATIFGSWVEGFGLPVLESLWRGLPCICHNGSALAEIAPGGGAIMVDMENSHSIAEAISKIATDQSFFRATSRQAVTRPIRTWEEYGGKFLAVLENADFMNMVIRYDPIGI